MTEEEMDAELDQIEAQEARLEGGEADGARDDEDPVEVKLRRVQTLRDEENQAGARDLLYEVLAEGNDDQRKVARNILQQLDA